eukprot:TRINITY_DN6617_c0_g1_i1.p1 TRINITY_DN6617_c0_g1~~TRINITY_DN6617_c0_g1_i1.p1  ORF type:complete len:292 (-),score=58.25 TRINITY_DN6617_c0_g1_i1:76-951(-)
MSGIKEKDINVEDEELESTKLDELTIDISSDPRDRISPRENSVLQQLRVHPCAQGMNDRQLVIFLFSRKLNITRTVELINNYRKFLKEHGYNDRVVKFEELNRELVNTMYTFIVPDKKDLQGHLVGYIMPSRVYLKRYTVKEQLDIFMFHWERFLYEPLDGHRKGFVFVEDLKDMTLGHLDFKNGDAVYKSVVNNFPVRISGILILNSGTIFKALLKFAKLFVKKKILQRVMAVNLEDLPNYIDRSQLLDLFGGTVHYDAKMFELGEGVVPLPEFLYPPITAEEPKISALD